METFKDKDEEINYWKQKCEEIDKELEEFRESSHMIEAELETSLEQAEKQLRELRSKCNILQFDNDTLREKTEHSQHEKTTQIIELQDEIAQSRVREEHYRKYIQELEQKNDDLERAQRNMYVSLEEFETKLNASIERNVLLESELDEKESLKVMNMYVSLEEFETKLNASIERNVLLESELDEKESLKVMVQRLKDEARDLKQEIQVIQSSKTTMSSSRKSSSSSPLDSNKLPDSTSPHLNTSVKSPNVSHIPSPSVRLSSMSRASTVDLIADLLRKVGALEAKLASCRIINAESYPRGRRLNRSSTSSPTIHNLGRP